MNCQVIMREQQQHQLPIILGSYDEAYLVINITSYQED